MLKNGFLTFCCAFIPGAGQMYQGYMKRGLSLMLMCCVIGVLAMLLGLWLKAEDRKKKYGLELPNIKK